MTVIAGFFRILFFVALFIFLLELARDSNGVGQIMNDFWAGLDEGYSLEAGAGGGKYRTGQKAATR